MRSWDLIALAYERLIAGGHCVKGCVPRQGMYVGMSHRRNDGLGWCGQPAFALMESNADIRIGLKQPTFKPPLHKRSIECWCKSFVGNPRYQPPTVLAERSGQPGFGQSDCGFATTTWAISSSCPRWMMLRHGSHKSTYGGARYANSIEWHPRGCTGCTQTRIPRCLLRFLWWNRQDMWCKSSRLMAPLDSREYVTCTLLVKTVV